MCIVFEHDHDDGQVLLMAEGGTIVSLEKEFAAKRIAILVQKAVNLIFRFHNAEPETKQANNLLIRGRRKRPV